MGRRNQGPKLRWLKKRRCYYIAWSEGGRSRERSTGTTDREKAEIYFAGWLADRQKRSGPRDPSEVLVTDCLADYAESAVRRAEAGKVMCPDRIAYAITPLAAFFEGRACDFVDEDICRDYGHWRQRAAGTIRRELGVLRAAIREAVRKNIVTREIAVELPIAAAPKSRWLTREEGAALLRAARQSTKAARHLSTFILIGLYSGKRKEAILSLRWSQVDLRAGVIAWERQTGPRTTKRRGRNPVNPKLLNHLRRIRRFGSDLGAVVDYNRAPCEGC